jgi:5-methyltetrahydrofolate--homocysteine methyltransferase
MTFNKTPKGFFTIMGNSFSQFAEEMAKYQIPVIGANCSLDSNDMADLVKVMREATSLPLIAQANAGQPQLLSDGTVSYSQKLDDYLQYVPRMISNGAGIIGGCCGTDPLYIKRMSEFVTG